MVAPANSSFLICNFLTKHEMMLVPQPPYSPDLAPVDFFLFNKLKSVLEGWQFESVQVINENLLAELSSIPQDTFQECFQNGKKGWERFIQSGGEYFERWKPNSSKIIQKMINLIRHLYVQTLHNGNSSKFYFTIPVGLNRLLPSPIHPTVYEKPPSSLPCCYCIRAVYLLYWIRHGSILLVVSKMPSKSLCP